MAYVRRWGRSQGGRRKLRYGAASVLSAAIGQAVLMVAFGAFRWSALSASLFAFAVGAVSSYHLNRMWVWGRVGRSDLLREIIPFWVVAAAGLAVSTVAIVVAEGRAALVTQSHALRTAVVMTASCASVVVVWLLKYLILDRYVFVHRPVTQRRVVREGKDVEGPPASVSRVRRYRGVDN